MYLSPKGTYHSSTLFLLQVKLSIKHRCISYALVQINYDKGMEEYSKSSDINDGEGLDKEGEGHSILNGEMRQSQFLTIYLSNNRAH